MDQVAGGTRLVALASKFRHQVAQSPEPKVGVGTGYDRDRSRQQPDDVAAIQPLMSQLHVVLQVSRIERPPLVEVNIALIRKLGRTA